MPLEFNTGIEQAWTDLLLLLGWVLTGVSVVAVALCLLGGCLQAADRRRAMRNQRDLIARQTPQLSTLEVIGLELSPDNHLLEEIRTVDDGVQAYLYDEIKQGANRAFPYRA
jgi:hypothetical protein